MREPAAGRHCPAAPSVPPMSQSQPEAGSKEPGKAAGQDQPCGEAGGGQEVDPRAHRQATSPLPVGHASLLLVVRN